MIILNPFGNGYHVVISWQSFFKGKNVKSLPLLSSQSSCFILVFVLYDNWLNIIEFQTVSP